MFGECVCVCVCVSIIYTISISVTCVSQDEFCLITSNQQVYNFYVQLLKRKGHCAKQISDISELLIRCNTDSCCECMTGVVNIYLYGCGSLFAPECAVCICMCVC